MNSSYKVEKKLNISLNASCKAVEKLNKGAERAFGAAFFFLPISKPLLFIALAVAFVLFPASGGFMSALRSWRSLPWIKPAAVLAILPLLSIFLNDASESQSLNLKLSYYWLFAFVTFLAAGQMRIIVWIHALLWGIALLFVHAQLVMLGWWKSGWGLSGAGNYILYSQFLAVGIVLLSILYKHESDTRWKFGYVTGIMFFFYGLASSAGRTGMLVVAILLPFIICNIVGRKNIAKVMFGCIVALAMLLASPMVQNRIGAAVEDVRLYRNNVTQTSIGLRFEMWKTAWDVLRTHPVMGGGPTEFGAAWRMTSRNESDLAFVEPHNAFLFYAASYGTLGLAALLWLYAALFWTGWKQRHSLVGGIVLAFAVICIVSSFTNTLFMGTVSLVWLMLFVGLQGGLVTMAPRESAPEIKTAHA